MWTASALSCFILHYDDQLSDSESDEEASSCHIASLLNYIHNEFHRTFSVLQSGTIVLDDAPNSDSDSDDGGRGGVTLGAFNDEFQMWWYNDIMFVRVWEVVDCLMRGL